MPQVLLSVSVKTMAVPIKYCKSSLTSGVCRELLTIVFVGLLQLVSSTQHNAAYSHSFTKVTFVSQATGRDEISCVDFDWENITTSVLFPCKSIHFAYIESLTRISNFTKVLSIRLLDEVYYLDQTLKIDRPKEHLKLLEINGVDKNRTLITSPIIQSSSSHTSGHEANIQIVCPCCKNHKEVLNCHFYSVSLFNLKFSGFGPLLPAAVVLWQIPFMNISNCIFYRNWCSGINALDSGLEITETDFIENINNKGLHQCTSLPSTFPLSNISLGGAVGIIFNQTSRRKVLVKSCNFIRNSAVRHEKGSFYIAHSPNNSMYFRVGAGILLVFSNFSHQNEVNLLKNSITHNKAFSGAGLTVITQDYAHDNFVRVKDSLLAQNEAQSTSAGILLAAWDYSNNNEFLVDSCKILDNTAAISAGLKAIFHSVNPQNQTFPASQTVNISKSIFCGNNAETAAGLHFIYALPNGNKLPGLYWIDNSTFCSHITSKFASYIRSMDHEKRGPPAYGGTLLTNRVDINFHGDCYIFKNEGGSALYSSNSEIHVQGSLTFYDNMAQLSGGAMTLADVSHLVLHPGAHLRFVRNYARIYGGALAIYTLGIPELVYQFNPTCFIQYSDTVIPPSKWDVTLEFVENGAGFKGAAVFINTLTSCLWSDKPPHVSFQNALRWSNKSFIYRDNYLTGDANTNDKNKVDMPVLAQDVDIATDVSSFKLSWPKTVEAAPGEKVEFNMTATDELGNPVYSVPIANSFQIYPNHSFGTDYIKLNKQYYIIPPTAMTNPVLSYSVSQDNYEKFKDKDDVRHRILFSDTYSSFLSDAEMSIKPVPCRPGFVFDSEEKTCVCDTKQDDILRCEGTKVYLYKGYFANVSGNKLVTYYCPNNYCKCKSSPERDVLGCEFDYRHPEKQCAANREGPLCGACKEGLTVSLHGDKCIECNNQTKTSLWFIGILLLVATVSILIVVLNPSFSTKLRGAMFYYQMLTYVIRPYDDVGKIVASISSVFELVGPAGLPVNGCLIKGLNNLQLIALGYFFPFVIFCILGTIYCLGRAYIINLKRDSPFESFWILLVLMYTLISEDSLLFHCCIPFAGKRLFFYDGSFECYQGQHLFMVTIATMVLLIFVLPPPILVLLICFGYVRAEPQVTDALTKGLRTPFRWWWAIDLGRRLIFVAIYVFIPGIIAKQVLFIVSSLSVLVLHSQCQPYTCKWANLGETFLLFCLTNLATLQIVDNDYYRTIVSAFILLITNAYILVVVCYLVFNFIRAKCQRRNYSKIIPVFCNESPYPRLLTPNKKYTTPPRVLGYPPDVE